MTESKQEMSQKIKQYINELRREMYNTDDEFRKKILEYTKTWKKNKYNNDDEYKNKINEYFKQWRENNVETISKSHKKASKKMYDNNEEYRQKQKQRALARYYRLKNEKQNSNMILAVN